MLKMTADRHLTFARVPNYDSPHVKRAIACHFDQSRRHGQLRQRIERIVELATPQVASFHGVINGWMEFEF